MRTLAATIAAVLALASPAIAQPVPLPPIHVQPLALVKLTPAKVDANKSYKAELTYRQVTKLPAGIAPALQVAVTWEFFSGAKSLGTATFTGALAKTGLPNGLVARVPLETKGYANLTHVAWRAQAFAISFGAGAQLVPLSLVGSGKIPVGSQPVVADVVKISATEFGGGFGAPPPHPVTPPPPAIDFQVTVQNRTAAPLATTDPTLGVEVKFAEVTATGTGAFTTIAAKLTATIPANGQGTESLGTPLPHVYSKVVVTAALVRLDANGKVVAYLSAPSAPVTLDPPVFYPPAPPPPPAPTP